MRLTAAGLHFVQLAQPVEADRCSFSNKPTNSYCTKYNRSVHLEQNKSSPLHEMQRRRHEMLPSNCRLEQKL